MDEDNSFMPWLFGGQTTTGEPVKIEEPAKEDIEYLVQRYQGRAFRELAKGATKDQLIAKYNVPGKVMYIIEKAYEKTIKSQVNNCVKALSKIKCCKCGKYHSFFYVVKYCNSWVCLKCAEILKLNVALK